MRRDADYRGAAGDHSISHRCFLTASDCCPDANYNRRLNLDPDAALHCYPDANRYRHATSDCQAASDRHPDAGARRSAPVWRCGARVLHLRPAFIAIQQYLSEARGER